MSSDPQICSYFLSAVRMLEFKGFSILQTSLWVFALFVLISEKLICVTDCD